MDFSKIIKTTERDWVKDFEHENGMYQNICRVCDKLFIGHKRRFIYRVCSGGNNKEEIK